MENLVISWKNCIPTIRQAGDLMGRLGEKKILISRSIAVHADFRRFCLKLPLSVVPIRGSLALIDKGDLSNLGDVMGSVVPADCTSRKCHHQRPQSCAVHPFWLDRFPLFILWHRLCIVLFLTRLPPSVTLFQYSTAFHTHGQLFLATRRFRSPRRLRLWRRPPRSRPRLYRTHLRPPTTAPDRRRLPSPLLRPLQLQSDPRTINRGYDSS